MHLRALMVVRTMTVFLMGKKERLNLQILENFELLHWGQ